jgi:hypothetical protein
MTTHYACERVVEEDELSCDCVIPNDVDLVGDVLDAASDVLAIITGAQIGRCSATFRPCREPACPRPRCCACCGLLGIHLWGIDPDVTQVLIDGAVVDPATYTIITNPYGVKVLERFDSNGYSVLWPTTQKLVLPSSAPDTFEITVTTGLEPGVTMKMAVAEIACEMFAGLAGESTTLDGAVSATMFGLTVDYRRFGDPTDQATMNMAGLNWVQRFISVGDVPSGAQILAPELDDGWSIFQRAA